MKLQTLLAVAIFALVFQGISGAAIYRWVDQNGVVTFRETPPAENPQAAQIVSAAVSPAITSSPADASGTAAVPDKPRDVAKKPGNTVPQVELYVTSWCPYCKKAEAFFREQGIPFTAYDVEKDSAAARRKEELDSSKGVPLAIINGQKIHGYSESAYREALKKKP